MLGVVIVGHGYFARELLSVLTHVVGPQDFIETVNIQPDDNMEVRRKDILESIKKVDQGHGVVVLTDMFGGTPSNLAISLLEKANIEIIAGVNLPLLIKLMKGRKTQTLHQAVLEAQEAGRKYIHAAGQLLNMQNEATAS
ncbi:Mannose-specific PTS enzyme IIAB component [Candidatus Bealeia paramacronuclearis]|uniref:Mannose-specific PTS enzyme IIAB component n=1 Tax=Candidatus Bealeia paramacronuclearis TaxID=1921001 RepID=A0ABZ2C8P5_9PROT|nr:Mannose-specific PTS enzyme IIAB component [Candidatus Bealeia paramacronuclearis]